MINDTPNLSIEEQKVIMLNLLEKLITFLDDNGLRYTLAYGTLIGAVRHHGFIPWDDDIDITMPYEDYEQLITILKTKKIADNIKFTCYESDSNHLWPFGKVYDTSTKLDEMIYRKRYAKRQELMKYGLYIDVFPIYPVSDDPAKQKKLEKQVKRNYKNLIHASRIVVFPKGLKNLIKRITYNIAFIPNRIMGLDYYLKKHDRLTKMYMKNNTNTICNNVYMEHFSFFDKNMYNETVLVPFENIKARIPARYDEILKKMYGNYMKLPPENERRTHVRKVEYR